MLYYNQQFKTWLHLWSHTVSVGQKAWSSLAGGCNLGSPNGVALQIAEAAILWRLGWAGGCASKKAIFIGSCRRLSSSAHGLVFRALRTQETGNGSQLSSQDRRGSCSFSQAFESHPIISPASYWLVKPAYYSFWEDEYWRRDHWGSPGGLATTVMHFLIYFTIKHI